MRAKLQAGSKAYLDTFSGMVPCVVLRISGNSQGHVAIPSPEVTVRITESRAPYYKGEVITSTGFHVCPRSCRVQRGCYWRINTAYDIIAG